MYMENQSKQQTSFKQSKSSSNPEGKWPIRHGCNSGQPNRGDLDIKNRRNWFYLLKTKDRTTVQPWHQDRTSPESPLSAGSRAFLPKLSFSQLFCFSPQPGPDFLPKPFFFISISSRSLLLLSYPGFVSPQPMAYLVSLSFFSSSGHFSRHLIPLSALSQPSPFLALFFSLCFSFLS